MLISYPGHHNHYPILFREAFNVTFIFSFPIHSWTWSSLAFILTTGLKWLFLRLLKASTWPNPMVSESPSWSPPSTFLLETILILPLGNPSFFILFLFHFSSLLSMPHSQPPITEVPQGLSLDIISLSTLPLEMMLSNFLALTFLYRLEIPIFVSLVQTYSPNFIPM